MIWDIHVHVAGVGAESTGNFLGARDFNEVWRAACSCGDWVWRRAC